VLTSASQQQAREGIVPAAIRQMARDLRDYEQERLGDIDAAVDRTVTQLTRSLGRYPTVGETALAAGLDAETVLEAWMRH
jgi:hypothetical protein